jgi:hypothetical protein
MPQPHAPISEEYHAMMNKVAEVLDNVFNPGLKGSDKKVAFALLIMPFGEEPDARVNYISNASREDMIAALKEFLARNEGRYVSVVDSMQ